MKACIRHEEVVQTVRAGWWPSACTEELREHVAACSQCAEAALMPSAFATARAGAMRMAAPQAAGVLWWKAQLRRRREAMEKLERPGLMISAWTIAASIVLLMAVLVTAWKRSGWSQVQALFASARWNTWIGASVLVLVCGFAVVAVMVGMGLAEGREQPRR